MSSPVMIDPSGCPLSRPSSTASFLVRFGKMAPTFQGKASLPSCAPVFCRQGASFSSRLATTYTASRAWTIGCVSSFSPSECRTPTRPLPSTSRIASRDQSFTSRTISPICGPKSTRSGFRPSTQGSCHTEYEPGSSLESQRRRAALPEGRSRVVMGPHDIGPLESLSARIGGSSGPQRIQSSDRACTIMLPLVRPRRRVGARRAWTSRRRLSRRLPCRPPRLVPVSPLRAGAARPTGGK